MKKDTTFPDTMSDTAVKNELLHHRSGIVCRWQFCANLSLGSNEIAPVQSTIDLTKERRT
jgi:hypothetical protein